MDKKEEIFWNLKEMIETFDELYYKKSESPISDKKYDALVRELKELGKELGMTIDEKIGSDLNDDSKKIQHKVPMMSIQNCYTKDEAIAKIKEMLKKSQSKCKQLIATYKIDGISASILYKDGIFNRASTRGNGEFGEDITVNAVFVDGVNKRLENSMHCDIRGEGTYEIRGEIYCPKSVMKELNESITNENKGRKKQEPLFKNERSVASGTIKQGNPLLCKQRGLKFIAHSVGYCDNLYFSYIDHDYFKVNSFTNYMNFAKEVGIKSVYRGPLPYLDDIICDDKDLFDFVDGIEQMTNDMDKYDIPIDGIVVRLNDFDDCNKLGANKKYPKWAIACKFFELSSETILRDIEYTVGKTGLVTPVAIFDTINLDGTDVSRASVGTENVLVSMNVGVGDKILVEKAGKIIPKIKKVITRSETERIGFIKKCPVCGGGIAKVGKQTFCYKCSEK